MKHLIDDNGVVRDMTPEEIAAWEAECAAYNEQLAEMESAGQGS